MGKCNGQSSSVFNYNVITTSVRLNENGLPNFVINHEKNASNSYFVVTSLSHYNSAINLNDNKQNIEVGDRLLSINGKSIGTEKSLTDVLALLKGSPRNEIYLVMQRVPFEKQENLDMENNLHLKQSVVLSKNVSNKCGISLNGQNLGEKPLPKPRSMEQINENVETVADLEFGDTSFDGLVEVFNFYYN